jgi:hypothetical protein
LKIVSFLREHFSSERKCIVGSIAHNVSFESCRLKNLALLLRREYRLCSLQEPERDHSVFDLEDLTGDHFSHTQSFGAVWKLCDEVFGSGEFGSWVGGAFNCRECVSFSQ